eukprot:scaffold458186_cov19-Prasinocladus_malaysianus.AAC.1
MAVSFARLAQKNKKRSRRERRLAFRNFSPDVSRGQTRRLLLNLVTPRTSRQALIHFTAKANTQHGAVNSACALSSWHVYLYDAHTLAVEPAVTGIY